MDSIFSDTGVFFGDGAFCCERWGAPATRDGQRCYLCVFSGKGVFSGDGFFSGDGTFSGERRRLS
jgi:hypothetical protein